VRLVYLSLGHTFTAIGFVGLVVPLLPTTPFLILAAACYSRGSERFERWLLTHPRFGAGVRAWRDHGVISVRAKTIATIGILVSLTIPLLVLSPPWKLVAASLVGGALLFIHTRPSRPPERSEPVAVTVTSDDVG
jgi:uncharacterized membrane protein YbaN (DUF454 family)